MDRFLRFLGFHVAYECSWGLYENRYDSIDAHCGRPIHKHMSVAPPWAKRRVKFRN